MLAQLEQLAAAHLAAQQQAATPQPAPVHTVKPEPGQDRTVADSAMDVDDLMLGPEDDAWADILADLQKAATGEGDDAKAAMAAASKRVADALLAESTKRYKASTPDQQQE